MSKKSCKMVKLYKPIFCTLCKLKPPWLDLSFRLKKAIYSSNDTQKKVEKITIALEVVGYIRKSIGIMHREQAGN